MADQRWQVETDKDLTPSALPAIAVGEWAKERSLQDGTHFEIHFSGEDPTDSKLFQQKMKVFKKTLLNFITY